jgi:hypothetical protein
VTQSLERPFVDIEKSVFVSLFQLANITISFDVIRIGMLKKIQVKQLQDLIIPLTESLYF